MIILNALARIIYYLGIVLAGAVIGGLVIGCLVWLGMVVMNVVYGDGAALYLCSGIVGLLVLMYGAFAAFEWAEDRLKG